MHNEVQFIFAVTIFVTLFILVELLLLVITQGRKFMKVIIKVVLCNQKYVYHDLTVSSDEHSFYERGHDYTLDHVLLTQGGLHILTTKGWTGKLYGTDKQRKWVWKHHKKEHSVDSPIWVQNTLNILLQKHWENWVNGRKVIKLVNFHSIKEVINHIVVIPAKLDTSFVYSRTPFINILKIKNQTQGKIRLNKEELLLIKTWLDSIKINNKVGGLKK